MKLTSMSATGSKSTVQANDSLFGLPVNLQLLAKAIRVQIDNGHQGTSHAQSRSEVSLTKKKIYRQKGTGGARHGAKSAPIFVGGGVTFGPIARTTKNLKISAVQKQAALKNALSLQAPQTVVIANLEDLGTKTKQVNEQLKNVVPAGQKALVVVSKTDANQFRGFTNLPYVQMVSATQLNTLQVCQASQVIVSPEAIEVLEARLIKDKKKSAVKPVDKAAATKQAKSAQPTKKTVAKKAPKKATKKTVKKVEPKTQKKTAAAKPATKKTSKKKVTK